MGVDVLIGIRDVKLAEITRDDIDGYGCKDAVALPLAVRLRLSHADTFLAVYSDEGMRGRVRTASGIEAELRLAGADPSRLAELGLWAYDEATGTYRDGLPRGGKGYALQFKEDTLDGGALRWLYRVFWIEEVRLDEYVTRGAAANVREWIVTGALRYPRCERYPWREAGNPLCRCGDISP
ncbi:MAG: hypothetical protein LBK46_06850 [Oscillospiraceae bacterium]|jgi:hypothetical protein|nr:hypothetical protein [Oscillospiraceae bacterium]